MTRDAVELIFPERPPSVNNRSTKVRDVFEAAMAAEWATCAGPPRTDLLHGLVVWFVREYRTGNDPDADNISKAVWDTLKKLGAFNDDKQVRLRTALIVDLAASSFAYFDLTRLPERAVRAIEALINRPDLEARGHVTYVRFGALEPSIVGHALTLGLEQP